jgi:CHAT domain-containing protein
VADGELLYLPFGALPAPETTATTDRTPEGSGHHPPLVKTQEIVNIPSASVLSAIRQSTRRERPPKSVAVFADPVFEKDDPRIQLARGANVAPPPVVEKREFIRQAVRDTSRDGTEAGLPRLPSTNEEARNIVSAAPTGSWMKATGFEATREKATDARLAQYRVVHFATHGLLDEQQPDLSGVVLSLYDEQGRFHGEGFLRLSDIYGMDLPVDLVVLSACRTGLGKKVRGEGLIGLTRGFMYAGARRVVASLWKVDDEATAELMKLFYENMFRREMTPSAALKAAQSSMSEHKRWSNPYYWAGFILQGDWR